MANLYLMRFDNTENNTWFKIGRSDDVHVRARQVSGTLGLPYKILSTIAGGGQHECTMVKGMREVYGAAPGNGRELFCSTSTDASVRKVFQRYYNRILRCKANCPARSSSGKPIRKRVRSNLRRSGTLSRPAWSRGHC